MAEREDDVWSEAMAAARAFGRALVEVGIASSIPRGGGVPTAEQVYACAKEASTIWSPYVYAALIGAIKEGRVTGQEALLDIALDKAPE